METLREYFILRARRYHYDKNLGFDSMTEQLVLYVIALLFILMFPIVFGWIMAHCYSSNIFKKKEVVNR